MTEVHTHHVPIMLELVGAQADLEQAKENYTEAIRKATEAELSNVKIAQILGITETAVRNYKRRHGIRGRRDRYDGINYLDGADAHGR